MDIAFYDPASDLRKDRRFAFSDATRGSRPHLLPWVGATAAKPHATPYVSS